MPENLVESELFGYEKGAFTGANREKPGYFELANNGTLFLDEIGEMPLTTQVKLLRVVESGKVQKLGGTDSKNIDVRIIAATNKNLETEVKCYTGKTSALKRTQSRYSPNCVILSQKIQYIT